MEVRVPVSRTPSGIGTISWSLESRRTGHLRGLAVVPGWQGRGVSEMLLAEALHDLAAAGARRVTLDTTAPLAHAVRCYKRNGFRPTGRVAEFFGLSLFEYARSLEAPLTPRRGAGTPRSRAARRR